MTTTSFPSWSRALATLVLAAGIAAAPVAVSGLPNAGALVSAAQASEIRAIVNDEVVTSYDVARRAAFLRLQRQSGNLNAKATDELIEEAIKRDAIDRAGIRVPDRMVDSAFGNFASNNGMSTSQLRQILNQSGVTAKHFREFIRLQIGWDQTLMWRARNQGSRALSEQDVVAKMLERGGDKPTSTEYLLQQVIFLVPQDQRSRQLAGRRQEANNMRSMVTGCDGTIGLAQQLRDVTVRDLGRVLALELPAAWEDDVKGLQTGQTTRVKETERGVEFLVVCRARQVSDDRVAKLQFSTEELESDQSGEDFLAELRKNARIQRR